MQRYYNLVNIQAILKKHEVEEAGFEPAVQLPVRQFSKLVVLATHPSLRVFKELEGKINKTHDNSKLFKKKKNKSCNLLIRGIVYRISLIEEFQLRTTINESGNLFYVYIQEAQLKCMKLFQKWKMK